MADCCTGPCSSDKPPVDTRYRRTLWIALIVNGGMFVVEMVSGWNAGSVSLLAESVDFFGDASNYAVSLFVLGLAPVWRSRTALVKGLSMGSYGIFVLGSAIYHLAYGTVPESSTMGIIGFLALVANLSVAALLYAYREGDANMRSVWLCSRNDAIGNIAVMLAALGVYGSGSGWPDILVATLMGALGLTGAWSVVKHARSELSSLPMTISPWIQHGSSNKETAV
jgi:Co/Zn/Cd efflux system component